MQPTLTNRPPRRWRRVIAFAIAVLVIVASIWLLPWLLMPEDLRRMQGVWQLVRIETKTDPNVKDDSKAGVTITGSRFAVTDEPNAYLRLDPDEAKFSIFVPDENERKFLGFTVPAHLWLLTPSNCVVGNYELANDQLTLSLTGEIRNGQFTPHHEGLKVHLKRK
jgi:hypothetical protein